MPQYKIRSNHPLRRRCCVLLAALALVHGAGAAVRAEVGSESLEQRRQRVAAMPAEEFDRLRRNYRQFESLSSAERDRLRRLYEQIEAHPDRAQLRAVMENYHRWVRSLRPAERDELLSTPPSERLAKVRELRRRAPRGRRPFLRLGRIPTRGRFRPFGFGRWVEDLLGEKLTPEQREALRQTKAPADHARQLLEYVRAHALLAGTKPLSSEQLSDERLREIVSRFPNLKDLTPAARREWLGWRLRLWAVALTPRNEPLPSIPEDELQKFFIEEVQPYQLPRDHFRSISGAARDGESQWKRDLTVLYWNAHPEKRPAAQSR